MWLWDDIKAKANWCYGTVTWRTIVKTLLTDGTPAMVWYRLMQASRRCRLEPLAMLFNKANAICCGCIIGRGADFGPRFVLVHSHGVVINSSVRGGEDVVIEHQVTIGAEKNESPLLGSDVFIGAGAKIVGAVRIGSHSKIGANAVVVHDVPEGATVGGIPAKILKLSPPPDAQPKSAAMNLRIAEPEANASDVSLEDRPAVSPARMVPLAIAGSSAMEDASR